MPYYKKTILFLFSLFLIITFFARDYIDIIFIQNFIIKNQSYAPIIFILTYFLLSLLFFPVFILTLASGALFGPYWGTFYTLISATACASCTMLLSKFFLQDWQSSLPDGLVKILIQGVNQEGLLLVAFIRLVPIFPFSVANYALGFSNVSLIPYTLTNFICMFPASFAYSYIGFLGKSAATDPTSQFLQHGLIALALFACVILMTSLLKKHYAKKFKIILASSKDS